MGTEIKVIASRIRAAYRAQFALRAAAGRRGEWVRLEDIRRSGLLVGYSREEVDAGLMYLHSQVQAVHLIPESNQKALSAGQREAAFRAGGQSRHLIMDEVKSRG